MNKFHTLLLAFFLAFASPVFAQTATGTIQIKRGPVATMGTLLAGQLYHATDTNVLYIGSTTGNKLLYNGIAGPQGPKGDSITGPAGTSGQAATISVGTVTTLPPGSNATVTNVGTTSAAVLNVGIPSGAGGAVGPAGVAGSNGWSPIFAVVADGARYVLQVTDWAGGSGTKPATGSYLGSTGFTSTIANAVNIRGVAGSAGANGIDGQAATVSVGTVTTLAAGSNATVTNTGTANAAVFAYGIPRGATGLTGSVGPQGPSGVVTATLPLTYNATTQTVGINPATTTTSGSFSAADKAKLDALGIISLTDGAAPIPAIATGASYDVTVTFNAPLTGTTFFAVPSVIAGSITLNLAQPVVKSVTSTSAVITLKNNALISVTTGATLLVLAYGK